LLKPLANIFRYKSPMAFYKNNNANSNLKIDTEWPNKFNSSFVKGHCGVCMIINGIGQVITLWPRGYKNDCY
jgi:hypothetical protein